MRTNEVCREHGLTRKAAAHYAEQGLLRPSEAAVAKRSKIAVWKATAP